MLELFLPYGYAMLVLMIWFCRKSKDQSVSRLLGQLVILFVTQQPIQINVILTFLKQFQIEDSIYVVQNHPLLKTDSPQYQFFKILFIYPAFALWVVIYPLVIIIGIRYYNRKRKRVKLYLLFGFLILGYEQRGQYWEFVKIFLRIFILFKYELNSD